MSINLSAKYYQENKKITKKSCENIEIFLKKKKKKKATI